MVNLSPLRLTFTVSLLKTIISVVHVLLYAAADLFLFNAKLLSQ
jgi:hypothetical protein